MLEKTIESKSSNKYPFILCTAALASGVSYLYYKLYYNKPKNYEKYSKEKVIKVLKRFQKEFYSINREIRIAASVLIS